MAQSNVDADTQNLFFRLLQEQQDQQISEFNDEKRMQTLLNPLTTQLQSTSDTLMQSSFAHSQLFTMPDQPFERISVMPGGNLNAYRRRSTGCFASHKPLIPMQPLQESTYSSMSNLQQYDALERHLSSINWLKSSAAISSTPTTTSTRGFFNQSSPISPTLPNKARYNRRQSLSSATMNTSFGSMQSATSTPNIWERVLQQQQQQQQSLFNSTMERMRTNNLITSFIENNLSLQNPLDPSVQMKQLEEELDKTGNMFHKREDWSIFKKVPVAKQNTIHMKLEDDGPFGNDEVRCLVLSHYSSIYCREVCCVMCGDEMRIYDRFPLVDGTLYVTPVKYTANDLKIHTQIGTRMSNRDQYIYAVCLNCINGTNQIKCKYCKQPWLSGTLQIGTLYKYDVFAAFPCCSSRLKCNKCSKQVFAAESDRLPYYSSYSDEIECPHCKTRACHFIKPPKTIYTVDSIRNFEP